MKQAIVLMRSLFDDQKEFESNFHSQIMAYDDGCEKDITKLLHQVKMLKAYLQLCKIRPDHGQECEQYEALLMNRLMMNIEEFGKDMKKTA